MSNWCSIIQKGRGRAVLVALLFGLCPTVSAQSVRGHCEIPGSILSSTRISVNAWIDANGEAQGSMVWIGGVPNTPPYPPGQGGPAEPFIVEVTDVSFFGNTAFVEGEVIASPGGIGNGQFTGFYFTDNSGTGQPDEINFQPTSARQHYHRRLIEVIKTTKHAYAEPWACH
jgi:hypothetical protein